MLEQTQKQKIAIFYSTVDGQTLKIIKSIVNNLEGEVTVFNIDDEPQLDFQQFDKVLVGASIRYGKLRKNILAFVNRHQQALDRVNNAFFLVCLTARKAEKALPANNAYMKTFLKNALWQPKLQAVFAGALLYSRYTWWQTLLIQLIMKITGGSTDKSRDLELTDWQKVEAFSREFNAL